MKLFEVEARLFSVLAVYNEDGVCQVMEKMRSVRVQHQDLVQQMAALLYEDVPTNGPPKDPRRFGPLFDEIIYEFKAVEYVTQEDRLGFRIACFSMGKLQLYAQTLSTRETRHRLTKSAWPGGSARDTFWTKTYTT